MLNNAVDITKYSAIAVYVEHSDGVINPVTFELLGKARELAKHSNQKVYAIFIGHNIAQYAPMLIKYGAHEVFLYQQQELRHFNLLAYADAFAHFIEQLCPSAVLVGGTNTGRSLAPRIAARFKTGLTADCTELEMGNGTELSQIRPAFGGNIMAKIVTPNHRPQLCTLRPGTFPMPKELLDPSGTITEVDMRGVVRDHRIRVMSTTPKEGTVDITDAEILVAVGLGVKEQSDLKSIEEFALSIGAEMACTRPIVEKGWYPVERQIGISGRTVRPKLLITLGISGAMQFTAGMKESECVIAVGNDKSAPIFEIANYGFIGDIYAILPTLHKFCTEKEIDV